MNPWTHVLGWTLIHFFWQGAIIAIVAAAALRFCRHRSANTRYALACAALAAMLAAPILSARVMMTPGPVIAPVIDTSPTTPAPDVASTAIRSWTVDNTLSMDELRASVDTLLPTVVVVWLVGVVALMIRMAGGLWHVRRLQI
jgi:hypothetical protein